MSAYKKITMNINNATVDYFKALAEETGIPYQTLMNLYLTDCAKNKRRINLSWETATI
ncbi:MAG: antitoxin [Firmicutes bacterium]|nr:antitoxin [Bacillota bacterium]